MRVRKSVKMGRFVKLPYESFSDAMEWNANHLFHASNEDIRRTIDDVFDNTGVRSAQVYRVVLIPEGKPISRTEWESKK